MLHILARETQKNKAEGTFDTQSTLRKLYFYFLSHWMRYDRSDSFPFDFEPNGIPFGHVLWSYIYNGIQNGIPFGFKLKGNRIRVFSV